MKYSLFAAALVTFLLVGCESEPGDGKEGQYPPSMYEDADTGERLGADSGQK
jgi:hypothetical protein